MPQIIPVFIFPTYRYEYVHNQNGRSAFKILTGKPLGRPRCRWEDNIRMILNKYVSIRGIGLIRLSIVIIGELF